MSVNFRRLRFRRMPLLNSDPSSPDASSDCFFLFGSDLLSVLKSRSFQLEVGSLDIGAALSHTNGCWSLCNCQISRV